MVVNRPEGGPEPGEAELVIGISRRNIIMSRDSGKWAEVVAFRMSRDNWSKIRCGSMESFGFG